MVCGECRLPEDLLSEGILPTFKAAREALLRGGFGPIFSVPTKLELWGGLVALRDSSVLGFDFGAFEALRSGEATR